MVKYYSIEIIEKALEALDKGNKQIDVAKIFGITRQTLSSWVKLKEKTNSLEPDIHYNKLKFKKIDDEEFIKYMSSDNPDKNYNKTLEEIAMDFNVAKNTIWKYLHRLGYKFKKNSKDMWKRMNIKEMSI
jgi:transposase